MMMPKIPARGYVAYGHDIFMAAASFVLSMYLRLGESFSAYASTDAFIQGGIVFTAIAAAVFLFMGLYRGVWRYASLNDLMAITRAVTLVVLIFLLAMFLWTRMNTLPRSLPIINWFVLMALLGGPRFLYRFIKDRRFDLRFEGDGRPRVPVLLAGAGDGAELFIRSLTRTTDANYRVVGIASEKKSRVGRRIHGIEVLGVLDDLALIVTTLEKRGEKPQRLVLTGENMGGATVRTLFDAATRHGMTLARLPKLTDFKDGLEDAIVVKPVAIEDLLGRPQASLDREAMSTLIKGRRVLVTGAGGSIGSELVRQITGFGPSEITLLDHSEFNLYAIDLEIGALDIPRRAVIADVRNRTRICKIFKDVAPELVFHAAALKHVPLVEANIFEGVMTNVIGTVNVADACLDAGAKAMVFVSTDKAVNPTNIMGASKRIAEQYCQALDLKHAGRGKTRFITVRFGNVLGSTGSVVPLFQQQLAAGGPLTVTHPQMLRYFMTIREAVELILQASALGSLDHDGEGKIFVLDMGEPVRILDLAKQMIRLAGLKPDRDIAIEFVGLRPGEKLFEEMFHDSEALVPAQSSGLLLASPRTVEGDEMTRSAEELALVCANEDARALMAAIRRLVPEYREEEQSPPAKAASG